MNLLGVIIWTGKLFQTMEKVERDTECVRVGADYKAGSAGMRYNNVGKDGNGNIVDVRLILVGVENAESPL